MRVVTIAALSLALGAAPATVPTAGATVTSGGADVTKVVAASSVRPRALGLRTAAAGLQARASQLPNGRLRLHVRTGARSVQIRYVVAGRSIRSMTARARKGIVRVTLPTSATSVRVRASATSSRRATAWVRVPIASFSQLDQPPSPETIAAWEAELLTLVNGVRAAGHICPGGEHMAPVPPLGRNAAMDAAARTQAAWMALRGQLSHDGPGGSSLGARLSEAGFTWHRAAENVAAGRSQPADTLAQWLSSAGHCRELMSAASTQTGIGYAYSTTSVYRHFWTQDFAAA